MQTGKPKEFFTVEVTFSKDDFMLLVERVGELKEGTEAEYIHRVVMRSLRRKSRKAVKDVQP